MKRRILNLLALLVIVAIGFLASRYYDKPRTISIDSDTPAPDVKYLGIVEILFEPENGRIAIALEIPERLPPSGGIIGDILEVYRWSRSYYLPIKCGDDYPPELCKIGQTEIYLLSRSKMPVVGGTAEIHVVKIVMGLDQVQMDKLLNGIPPETLQELFGFHLEVAQATQGTGGYLVTPDQPPIFIGIPR